MIVFSLLLSIPNSFLFYVVSDGFGYFILNSIYSNIFGGTLGFVHIPLWQYLLFTLLILSCLLLGQRKILSSKNWSVQSDIAGASLFSIGLAFYVFQFVVYSNPFYCACINDFNEIPSYFAAATPFLAVLILSLYLRISYNRSL